MHNLGESLFNAGKIDSAKQLTFRAIQINQDLGRLSVLSSCYKVLGEIYLKEASTDSAKFAFHKVLEISETLGAQSQKVSTNRALLHMAGLVKDKQELSYLTQALANTKIYAHPSLTREVYNRLIQFHVEHKNTKTALEYLSIATILNDSLDRKQEIDRSALMKSAIESFELEQQATNLKQINRYQQNILILSIITIMILVTLSWFYFRLYKKLQVTNQELESQQKLLITQTNDLIERNHIKDKFFGIVAHDLRCPIGTLIQVADLYFDQKELVNPNDIKQLELTFKRTIYNTYNLTENLIFWAKLQMNREPTVPELVNVFSTVESILVLLKEKIEFKQLHLQLDISQDVTVYCDKNQFEFIIRNLLNNSTKFCKVNDTIWISAIRTNENPSLL